MTQSRGQIRDHPRSDRLSSDRPRGDQPPGILHGDGAPERFTLGRYCPSQPQSAIVDRYWITRWNVDARSPHRQEILPHPCVHLVIEDGCSGVFGIGTGRFVKVLKGRGRAFGVKFWPGAFRRWPASALASSGTPLSEVFGSAGDRYERGVLATDDDQEMVRLAEAFVLAQCPLADIDARLARRVVESIAGNRDLGRVEDVARCHRLSVRSLQRLFERCVGVSPKWVLQRCRIHEAVERLEVGERVDFAALATHLGYFDQAHFVRDFTNLVGRSPGRYRAALTTS